MAEGGHSSDFHPYDNKDKATEQEPHQICNLEIFLVMLVKNNEVQHFYGQENQIKEEVEKRFNVLIWDEQRHEAMARNKIYISGSSIDTCVEAKNYWSKKLGTSVTKPEKILRSIDDYCGNCLDTFPGHYTHQCPKCSNCFQEGHLTKYCPRLPPDVRCVEPSKNETLPKNKFWFEQKAKVKPKPGEEVITCRECKRRIPSSQFYILEKRICTPVCYSNSKRELQMLHGAIGRMGIAKCAPYFNDLAPSYKLFTLNCVTISEQMKTYFVVVKGKPPVAIPQVDAAVFYMRHVYVKAPTVWIPPSENVEIIVQATPLTVVKETLKTIFTDGKCEKRLYTWNGISDLHSLGITVQELKQWGTTHIDLQNFFVDTKTGNKPKLCNAIFAYFGDKIGDFESRLNIRKPNECEKDARNTLKLARHILDKHDIKSYQTIMKTCKDAGLL